MDVWTQLVASVGFPIVAFFICVYALKYAYDKSREDNKEAFTQISTLTEAVNNNTTVLVKLVENIEHLIDITK